MTAQEYSSVLPYMLTMSCGQEYSHHAHHIAYQRILPNVVVVIIIAMMIVVEIVVVVLMVVVVMNVMVVIMVAVMK